MSWNITIPATRVPDFGSTADSTLSNAIQEGRLQANTDAAREAEDQAQFAIEAAKRIVSQASLGGPGAIIAANISGHANPQHRPTPGRGPDTITIVLTQTSYPTGG